MAKFVLVHETGGPDRLRLEDGILDQPGGAEIKVRFEAIGLNRAECAIRGGYYVQRPGLPTRLGFEGAGRVTAVGEHVSDIAIGDYVSFIPGFALSRYGTYADEALMPAALAVKTPESVQGDVAAAMWMQYLTAYGGLVEAGALQKGETVLITAASSSVGLAAIEVCRKFGAVPLAATRGANKRERLLAVGAADVIVTDETPIDEAVSAATGGRGAQLIFDPIAGPGVEALGRAAAFNGRIILYGGMAGPFAPYPFMSGVQKGLSMRGFNLLELTGKSEWFARAKAFVLEGIADGSLSPIIDSVFALTDVEAAHIYLDSGRQFGKVLMRP